MATADEEEKRHDGADGGEDDDTKDDENPNKATPPPLTKLLLLARPEFGALSFAFLLMIVSEGVTLYNPILLAQAYDALVDYTTTNAEKMSIINRVMVVVLIIHAAGMVASFFRSAIMGTVGERVVARLRNRLYGSILKQGMYA